MSANHTPGPWRVNDPLLTIRRDGDYSSPIYAGTANSFECVADIIQAAIRHEARAQANARLIAAAPDLLAACKAADRLLLQVATLANNPDTIRYWPGGLREQVLEWLKSSPADKAIARAERSSHVR